MTEHTHAQPPTEAQIAEIRARVNDARYLGAAGQTVMDCDRLLAALDAAHAEKDKALARFGELQADVEAYRTRCIDIAKYAVHLGNCRFLEEPDICTCGLAAHSEVLGDE